MDAKTQASGNPPGGNPLPDHCAPNHRIPNHRIEEPAWPRREPLQLVGFRVGTEEFGLDILRVREIIRVPQLTRVPRSPEIVDGVMNLRGRIIPVIALRKRFGLEQAPAAKNARIVVVEIQGSVLGLIVDSVSEVLRIPAETVEPPPRLGGTDQEYVSGVGKLDNRLLLLLDADRLTGAGNSDVEAPGGDR